MHNSTNVQAAREVLMNKALSVLAVCLIALCATMALPAKASAIPSATYKVTLVNPTGPDTTSVVATRSFGGSFALPWPASTSEYAFLGWAIASDQDTDTSGIYTYYDSIDFDDNVSARTVTIEEDATYYAQWAKIEPLTLNTLNKTWIGYDNPLYDSDYARVLSVQLTAGTTYYFEHWMPYSDAYLTLTDGFVNNNNYLESDDDRDDYQFTRSPQGHYSSAFAYTPEKSGTYYLIAEDYGSADSYHGPSMSYVQVSTKSFRRQFGTPVNWYDGQTLISTNDVKMGYRIEPRTIARKGKTFWGWFEDASFTVPVDFTNKLSGESQTSIYGKYTSNEARLRGVRGSTGRPAGKFNPLKSRSTFIVGKNKSKVRIVPLKKNAQATTYIKVGNGKYKKASSVTLKLKRGQKKYLKVKVISQTGSKYMRTYTIAVRRR